MKAKEYEYPKFFRRKYANYIAKFTSLEEGVLMTTYTLSARVGDKHSWIAHTDTDTWEEIPCDKETGFYHKQLVWSWN